MDGLHLPEIVSFREQSGRCLGSVNKNITTHKRLELTSGRQTNSGEKRRSIDKNKSSRKKRTNNGNRELKTSLKKISNVEKTRTQPKIQNTRKHEHENIGLPKITTNNEDIRIKASDGYGIKKTRRRKHEKGKTLSYVYSKSLQDENSMAYLRNNVDFEKDFNTNIKDKRSSLEHKKAYGLPALKTNEESNEQEQFLSKDPEFSEASCSETESLLNAWEEIDDEDSNDTSSTFHSTDCSSEKN